MTDPNVIATLTAQLAEARAECELFKKHLDDLVQEQLVEINAEGEAFERECINILRQLMENPPGFDWGDYPDGWTADDAYQAIKADMDEAWANADREKARAESAGARFAAVEQERDGLREALQHMRWCARCAEGDWSDCEGGREALAALTQDASGGGGC